MSNSLPFKCYLECKDGGTKEIRRFTLDSDVVGNFTYLQEKIRNIYPQLLRENFLIQYIDDEGDNVTVSSDDELIAALMYVKREASEPFRLIVKATSSNKSDSTANSNQGNCQGSIHFGVTCDGCQSPVRGFRYKCFQCPDFDLCGKCESAGFHPGHTMIRVTGVMPPGFAAMKHLLVNGHLEPVRSWRRNHHGRNFCGVGPQHGRWNAWCPSGVDIDPTEANPVKEEKKQGEKKEKCPFKANVDQAKKTAESFQEMTPDFLVGLGNTIATILSQFGVDTQVDVHTPNSATCPRETSQKNENKTEEAVKTEPEKMHTTPVPKEETTEVKQVKQEAVKERVIPVIVDESERKVEPNPYSNVIQALAAVQIAEQAQEAAKMAINAVPIKEATAAARAAEEASKLVETNQPSDGSGKQRSPSPPCNGWTFVDEEKKPAEAQTELGARPKTPQQAAFQPATSALHPDPLIASALETMLAMGFTNEGGWLAQLLEVKRGDIGKALDVLQTRNQRYQH